MIVKKRGKDKKIIFILGGFFIALILVGGYFLFFSKTIEGVYLCGDETSFGECSLSKPYYCYEGILVPNAEECGCPDILDKALETCSSDHFTDGIFINLKYFIDGEEGKMMFVAYKGVVDYLFEIPREISYEDGQAPNRKDFKLKKIDDELQRQALMPLVVQIQNLAPGSKEKQAQIAISLVQNIPYGEPEFVSVFGGKYKIRAARYPYQTLYENTGSCECKSELLTFLLREIGYGVGMFYYQQENHEAVGVKCPFEEGLGGSGYCFVETTFPSPISYSGGKYLSGLSSYFLSSFPEFVLIQEGVSLGEDLEDYEDANFLNKVGNLGKINYFQKTKLKKIKKKYGMIY